LKIDQAEGLEAGFTLSLPSPARSIVSSQGQEARSATLSEAPVLQLFSSEELDVRCIETGDTEGSSLQSPACEELVVITWAMAKQKIDWLAEKQELCHKSKLYERFLPSQNKQLPCLGLPFSPDLFLEVSRSWKRPVSYRVYCLAHKHLHTLTS